MSDVRLVAAALPSFFIFHYFTGKDRFNGEDRRITVRIGYSLQTHMTNEHTWPFIEYKYKWT